MSNQLGKFFLVASMLLAMCVLPGWAASHHRLNGTWLLVPTRSNFAGQPVIQTGAVTINDREHHIYISRNFSYDNPSQSTEYSFSIDGQENSSIRAGKTFKTKARWDDKVLIVTTTGDSINEVERFSIAPDGMLMLVVERGGHPPETLYFQRQ
jgi:hypothetical protein